MAWLGRQLGSLAAMGQGAMAQGSAATGAGSTQPSATANPSQGQVNEEQNQGQMGSMGEGQVTLKGYASMQN